LPRRAGRIYVDSHRRLVLFPARMSNSLLPYCLILFLAAFASGMVILVRRWSDELLHMFLAFGAGVFLGIVFIHLIPESFPDDQTATVGFFVLGGYLLLFFLERILFSRGDRGYEHSHEVLGITALVGLSVHSLIDGLGLAVTAADPHLGRLLFVSILAHKVPAAFALASLLILAKQSMRRITLYLLLFASMTPVGALLLAQVFVNGKQDVLVLMTGLVTGSFLYIATGELLPEAFHSRRRRWVNLVLVLLGIVAIGWLGLGTFHGHSH